MRGGVDRKIAMLKFGVSLKPDAWALYERAYFEWTYVIIIPAEPMTRPGKTRGQYLSSFPVKGNRMVPMKARVLPKSINHLGLILFASDPVKDISSATTPGGSL